MTQEQIEKIVRRVVGVDFAFEVKSAVTWTRKELVADSYGAGRVWVAGDAAHVDVTDRRLSA